MLKTKNIDPNYDETRLQKVNDSTLHWKHDTFLDIRKTPNRGNGVFATKEIPADTYLGEFPGVLIEPHSGHFTKIDFETIRHFVLSNGLFRVQSLLENNFLPLITHSCEPNVQVFESSSRRYRNELNVHFQTLQPIKPNQELTIKYSVRVSPGDDLSKYRCLCWSKLCVGTMLDLEYYVNGKSHES